MVYKYGCSDAAFNNLGGTALVFWNAIQEAKDRGFVEFEMGRTDADNLGLVAYKERWGAARKSLNYWRASEVHAPEQAEQNIWKKKIARNVVSIAPDLVLQAVGTLLYRHIG